MNKVLIIAHQFPPMGGSGVQRTSKFVKYLTAFEWNPIVITREPKRLELTDKSLLNDISSDTEIIHTRSWDLTNLPSLMYAPGRYFARKALIPDAEILWQRFSRKKAVQIIKDNDIDIIYSTSYPYSDHLLAQYLKKKFPHIYWVADFRDEWTNNPYYLDKNMSSYRKKKEASMEADIMKNADYIIANTPIMMSNFISMYPDIKNKTSYISNGFDTEDYINIEKIQPSINKFTLTYTGALYGRRKPDTIFAAIKMAIDNKLIDENKITLQLVGNYKVKELTNKINSFNLQNVVNIIGYVPHDKCIEILASSHALVLIESGGAGSEAFYTGKIFEYLAIKKPIIANIPKNGAAADIIRTTNTGYISDSNDIILSSDIIVNLYKQWEQKEIKYVPDEVKISKYDRKNLTQELVNIFNRRIK